MCLSIAFLLASIITAFIIYRFNKRISLVENAIDEIGRLVHEMTKVSKKLEIFVDSKETIKETKVIGKD
jgi:hypothetical protein